MIKCIMIVELSKDDLMDIPVLAGVVYPYFFVSSTRDPFTVNVTKRKTKSQNFKFGFPVRVFSRISSWFLNLLFQSTELLKTGIVLES